MSEPEDVTKEQVSEGEGPEVSSDPELEPREEGAASDSVQETGTAAMTADDVNMAEVAEATAELAEAAVRPITFGALEGEASGEGEPRNLDLLLDVLIPVSVEVGRAQISLDAILKLVPGSIVALDKKAEEPVDLMVNGKLVARGEIVLVDDSYGFGVTEIVDPGKRLESLR